MVTLDNGTQGDADAGDDAIRGTARSRLTVTPDRAGTFTINVRIPGWARNESVPSDLYRFLDPLRAPAVAQGQRPGDRRPVVVEGLRHRSRAPGRPATRSISTLPMPARRVVAQRHRWRPIADRVALQRGPIVYAAEWPDNPDGHVRNLVLPDSAPLTAEYRAGLLNGVTVVTEHGDLARGRRQGRRRRRRPDRSRRFRITPGPIAAAARCWCGCRGARSRPGCARSRRWRCRARSPSSGKYEPQPDDDQRRRGSAQLRRLVRLLRLVAAQGLDRDRRT